MVHTFSSRRIAARTNGTHGLGSPALLTLLLSLPWAGAAAQVPPPLQARHSTHDFTEGPGAPNAGLAEVWVDTKSPGDGFTYSVGTIGVLQTIGAAATFSGAPVQAATGLAGFVTLPAAVAQKQVVILQVVDEMQNIVWQRFFYGFAEASGRFTNARGIAVWSAPDPVDTRIAICGESTHDSLPFDQNAPFPTAATKGFIAVFNGVGDLLWSHQLYGESLQGNPLGNMAVTDVAIRSEAGADVVTYCGFSFCGAGGLSPESASPVNPFPTVIAGSCPTEPPANGATDNGIGDSDGFVGRIQFAAGARNIDFHAVVGGNLTDVLTGIAEIDGDRFVVVGTTALDGASGSASPFSFPFTDGLCQGTPIGAFAVGTLSMFDASATPAGALQLQWSQRIGAGPSNGSDTSARDVVVQRDFDSSSDIAVVVGTTDDPDLTSSMWSGLSTIGPQVALAGGTDGYVLDFLLPQSIAISIPMRGTYRGGAGDDGLAGVQAWSEFRDHFAVVGFRDQQPGGADLDIASYWINTSGVFGPTIPDGLVLAREAVSGPTGSYVPTALGAANAGFAARQGGGVTVSPTGRVTAVGAYVGGVTYLATGAPNIPGRANNYPMEAYRVVLDMLPDNVGRTDGTGVPIPAPGPQYPLPAFFGGTTPECALVPFGDRAGDPAPATPILDRMLIDYIGPDPADNQPLALVVDRPPAMSLLVAGWQLEFPGVIGGTAPVPAVLPEGVIVWTTNAPSLFAFASSGQSFAQTWTLPDLPFGQTQVVTVQLVCLLDPSAAVAGGNLGPVCTGSSTFAASPALWFSYTGN